jgi:phospholipid transport system substrate-binding protein
MFLKRTTPLLSQVPHISRRHWLAGLAAGVVLATGLGASQPVLAQAPGVGDAPDALVKQASDRILDRLRQDPSLKSGDQGRIQQAIDELIVPYVDFDKTTRLAVGRYWRQATPDQQAQLVKSFRNMLVRTYSGSLANSTGQTHVDIKPLRADPGATDVVVHTTVTDGQREPVPVDYRLGKTPQGWKIYDLNVLGVWFIENYRNQFGPIVSQSGIDGLIKALNDRNAKMQTPGAAN